LPGDLPDQCGAVEQRARGHVEELEPEVAVGLLVELLEGERVLEADPPGRGGLDEALVADEEDRRLVRAFRDGAIDLTGEPSRGAETQIAAQSQGAHR
jgi:hypothetical protein